MALHAPLEQQARWRAHAVPRLAWQLGTRSAITTGAGRCRAVAEGDGWYWL